MRQPRDAPAHEPTRLIRRCHHSCGRHIYWSDEGSDTVGRANIDGTGVNQSFITGASVPNGLAVDTGHVYWTNEGSNTIGRRTSTAPASTRASSPA
jgi:Low-density lipoprotein receptor repeat class B